MWVLSLFNSILCLRRVSSPSQSILSAGSITSDVVLPLPESQKPPIRSLPPISTTRLLAPLAPFAFTPPKLPMPSSHPLSIQLDFVRFMDLVAFCLPFAVETGRRSSSLSQRASTRWILVRLLASSFLRSEILTDNLGSASLLRHDAYTLPFELLTEERNRTGSRRFSIPAYSFPPIRSSLGAS